MSRFYMTAKSEKKTEARKAGISHLTAHIRTWDHGVKVEYHVGDKGQTYCHIYETGGSHDSTAKRLIKKFELDASKAPNKRPGSSYYGHPIGG